MDKFCERTEREIVVPGTMSVHKKVDLLGGENSGISPVLFPLSTAQALSPHS